MTRELQFYLKSLSEYGIYAVVLTVLFILLFKFTLPEFSTLLQTRSEIGKEREKLDLATSKVKTLTSISQNEQEQKLQKLNNALPVEKDIGLMLSALEVAAGASGAKLSSFSFSGGSVATESATAVVSSSKVGVPAVSINVRLKGGLRDIASFIKEAQRGLPALEIESVSYAQSITTATINFYFKPLKLEPAIFSPLPQISPSQAALFKEIESLAPPSVVFQEVDRGPSRTNPFR